MGYAKSFHDDVEINMTSDSYKQSKESPNPSDNDNQVIHKIIRIRVGIGRSYLPLYSLWYLNLLATFFEL